MCVEHIKSPLDNARRKIEHIYTGPMESDLADMMVQCDADVCRFVCSDYTYFK
jgi:U5 small nuclear ribonucleoprotein component